MTYRLTTFAEQQLTKLLDYTLSEYGEKVVNRLSRIIDKDFLLLTQNPYHIWDKKKINVIEPDMKFVI